MELPAAAVTDGQAAALRQLAAVADAITASLAGDNLQGYNAGVEKLPASVAATRAAFAEDHAWTPALREVASAAGLQPAADLASARAAFLTYSSATSRFLEAVRRQVPSLALLKVYRCPMAPAPGYWIQLQPPLRNPYYGEEMLECGVEVKP
jgi:Cu(I)/Ag(I) efflux system membrane fusion protein